MTDRLDPEQLAEITRKPFLLATDFDGTLAPIVRSPERAWLPEAASGALERLSATAGVHLAILSGRSLPDLRNRISFPAVLAGNHGLEIDGCGMQYLHAAAARGKPLIAAAAATASESVAAWPEAWVEDKGLTASVHFRAVPERYRHAVMLAVRQALGPFGTELGLRAGKCSLEIHPRVEWHKGHAVRAILDHFGLGPEACICLGDDSTDETMFRSVPEAVTVRVGPPSRTAARYCLPDSAAAGAVLSRLSEILEQTAAAAAG